VLFSVFFCSISDNTYYIIFTKTSIRREKGYSFIFYRRIAMSQGKLIIFEGPDNSGKTTQMNIVPEKFANLLKERDNKKITYTKFKFPQANSLYGKLICHMLYNKTTYDLNKLENINLFSQLQPDDKLGGFKKISLLLDEYDYVFIDRFTLSSKIYDGASYYLLHNKTYIPCRYYLKWLDF
jgi:thymidylate kinase